MHYSPPRLPATVPQSRMTVQTSTLTAVRLSMQKRQHFYKTDSIIRMLDIRSSKSRRALEAKRISAAKLASTLVTRECTRMEWNDDESRFYFRPRSSVHVQPLRGQEERHGLHNYLILQSHAIFGGGMCSSDVDRILFSSGARERRHKAKWTDDNRTIDPSCHTREWATDSE